MATREIPKEQVKYRWESDVGHYRMTIPSERKALAKLREQEKAGEVKIESITWPPVLDNKGVPHVSTFHWIRKILSAQEIEEKEENDIKELINGRGSPEQPSSGPPPTPHMGIALTPEERELLRPWKGSPNDD